MTISPLFLDLKEYSSSKFKGDLSAGLTVGILLIPQGMAYAMLAELPPIYGLYSSLFPLLIYGIFGSSRQLSVAPTALSSILTASALGALSTSSYDLFSLSIILTLSVGLIRLLMGIVRLGFLSNFMSNAVISGFTTGAAIIIATSQLKHLFGINLEGGRIDQIITEIIAKTSYINATTLGIGLIGIFGIKFIKRINSKLPAALIILIFAIFGSYLFHIEEYGVTILGKIPSGLPTFQFPNISIEIMKAVFPYAFIIALIGFIEATSVSKSLQNKHKSYKVIPNQELIALGLSNIVGSFFQAFPTTGGFSRSAVNDQAGAKTGLASIISSFIVGLTLLFLTKPFFYLPNTILAAIILVSVISLIDLNTIKRLWIADPKDFGMMLITFLGTLFIGIQEGIAIGILASLLSVIYKASQPHLAVLGRIPDTTFYMNVERYDTVQNDEILIIRIDGQLFFANADRIQKQILQCLQKKEKAKTLIINAKAISTIDYTALEMIDELFEVLQKRGIQLSFSNLNGPVRDVLIRTNYVSKVGDSHFFMNVDEAVLYYEKHKGTTVKDIVLQSNNRKK
ncbi:SulP family inorganic anion transporter [Sediminitomix flava]|uniref:SulP family sulfate permease n=1 Tax=Sediminitomix flava TaxID=379075 RepID=A0A315Z8C4_SEDFL|nr:solute carrier family 26 protein [Sediminitomix flava]PWJ39950.1 SulP family sulfate permease [Sediminitomix flava]